MRVECRVQPIGNVDLVIGDPPEAALEFKFPRDATGSADTMTHGELLNDLCKLARVEAKDRWIVQLLGARIAGYLQRRQEVAWARRQGDVVALTSVTVAGIPETARRCLSACREGQSVAARCVAILPAGRLEARRVQVGGQRGGGARGFADASIASSRR